MLAAALLAGKALLLPHRLLMCLNNSSSLGGQLARGGLHVLDWRPDGWTEIGRKCINDGSCMRVLLSGGGACLL